MADLNFKMSLGDASVTSTAKTIFTLTAPANQRVKIKGISIFGKGTSNTDTPVKIEIIRANSISGGTAGTIVTSKTDGDMGETIQSTTAGNYSAEPTYSGAVVEETWDVHPQWGISVYFPLHDEMKLKGGTVFGLRATSNQNETMSFNVLCEE